MELALELLYGLGLLVWAILVIISICAILFLLFVVPHNERNSLKGWMVLIISSVIACTPLFFEGVLITRFVFNKDGSYAGDVPTRFMFQSTVDKMSRDKIVIPLYKVSGSGGPITVEVGSNIQAILTWQCRLSYETNYFFIASEAVRLGTYKSDLTMNTFLAASLPELKSLQTVTNFDYSVDRLNLTEENARVTAFILERLRPKLMKYQVLVTQVVINREN